MMQSVAPQAPAAPAPQVAPPQVPAPQAPAQVTVAYANNFAAKHMSVVLTAATALQVSNARNPKPQFNTVFRSAFIETTIRAAAAANAAGAAYTYTSNATAHPQADVIVCELHTNGERYRALPAATLYSYSVSYSISADGATVTISHLETAF